MSSKELTPGARVRYKPDGSILVLDRRKDAEGELLAGWWVRDGGGLADSVLDDPDSDFEIVSDPEAQVAEIMVLLREGGFDGDDVVAGVRGLITLFERFAERDWKVS